MGKKLIVDIDLCVGCYACEVACKQEHELGVGPHPIKVYEVGPKRIEGKLVMDYVPKFCMHCSQPACIEACPLDAITQRPDGIVLISVEKCDGCLKCMDACPFGIPEYNPETGAVIMCDLCVGRIDEGKLPACIGVCPSDALQFGDPGEFLAKKKEMGAREINYQNFPTAYGK